jgi:hypothetical protein
VNPQDPLAALHPLREPLPIDWWPLAPGWWILLVLLAVALLIFAWILLRRYKTRAYRREALAQLESLRTRYRQSQDANAYLAAANALLKSASLIAYPRRDVAASSGSAWLAFLNQGLDATDHFPEEFVNGAYRKSALAIDVDQLHSTAANWIRRHEAKR